MPHQIAYRPAGQPEQAQQPPEHRGPLDQQGEIALTPQQRLEPVDEAYAASIVDGPSLAASGPRQEPHQAQRAFVAQSEQRGVCATAARARPAAGSRVRRPRCPPAAPPCRSRGTVVAIAADVGPRSSWSSVSNSVATKGVSPWRSSSVRRWRGRQDPGCAHIHARSPSAAAGRWVCCVVQVLDAMFEPAQENRRPGAARGAWPGFEQPARAERRSAPQRGARSGPRGTARRAPPAAAGR